MYAVSPADQELSCLRVLLLHIPGARSFEDLRTVNGVLQDGFRHACIQLNLLDDDSQWIATMQEAAAFRMPSQLRFLFATLCNHCQLEDPLTLWNDFKTLLSEDYL